MSSEKSFKVEYFKELPDGGAIVIVDMDEETKKFLIGEGFLAVIKRGMENSESIVKPEHLEDTP